MVAIALATLAACLILLWGAAYMLQDSLIYFPARDVPSPESAGLPGAEEVTFAAEDKVRLHGWIAAPPGAVPAAAVVLLFHGNAGNVADRAWKLDLLRKAGFTAFVFDFRGYGRSEGRPGEAGLYADGRAAARLARRRAGGLPVIFYGESLGCAVAIETAITDPPAGLVLEAPFTSLAAVGKFHYPILPVGWLLRDRYENERKMAAVTAPLLVIHGEKDGVIPTAMGRAIHDAAASARKRFVIVPAADHNETVFFDAKPLLEWLRETAAGARGGG